MVSIEGHLSLIGPISIKCIHYDFWIFCITFSAELDEESSRYLAALPPPILPTHTLHLPCGPTAAILYNNSLERKFTLSLPSSTT